MTCWLNVEIRILGIMKTFRVPTQHNMHLQKKIKNYKNDESNKMVILEIINILYSYLCQ